MTTWSTIHRSAVHKSIPQRPARSWATSCSSSCRLAFANRTHCKTHSGMLLASRSLRRSLEWRAAGVRLFAKKRTVAAPIELADEDDRAAKRAELLRNLNHKFGKGTTWSLTDSPASVETTPSGCMTLDLAMGGGYPKGRIIEIFGPESTGKSTLALHAIAEVQKAGGQGYYVDLENAFDGEYATKLGVDKTLLLSQPGCGEDALNIVDEVARSGAVDIIVVDSVSALTPRSEIEGEIGTPQMGGQARLMSNALRRIVSTASKMKCTIIFINQLRSKVGVIYGNPETTSGGQALKYYASVRIDLRKRETIESGSGADAKEAVGQRIKAKVVKNKCAPPARVAEFDVMFGSGINVMGSLLDAAQALGVVVAKGSYYYFENNKLAQGREKTLAALKADPELLQKLEAQTKAEFASKTNPAGDDLAFTTGDREDVEEDFLDLEDNNVNGEQIRT